MKRIAFVGLGHMGGPMAANLVKAGYEVRAYDLSFQALETAEKAGCLPVSSVAEAVRDVDAVVSMLPTGQHTLEVYEGKGGVFQDAPETAILMDCSTIDIDSAKTVLKSAQDKGYSMVDAPVSGGVAAAQAGHLTFMVGGHESAVEKARPFLEAMGKNIVHAGQPGAGQAAKICNNMLLGISMIGACEAFALAEKLGLETQKFYDIVTNSSGQCWSVSQYCPAPGPVSSSPANHDYKPGFTATMMLKDLKLAQEAAHSMGAATPLGAQAQALYALFLTAGGGDKDFSGFIEFLR